MKVEAEGGRIYLPKETREKYGEEYRLIKMSDRIVLVPISENPLERLREITSGTEKSSTQLREEAREQLSEEAGR